MLHLPEPSLRHHLLHVLHTASEGGEQGAAAGARDEPGMRWHALFVMLPRRSSSYLPTWFERSHSSARAELFAILAASTAADDPGRELLVAAQDAQWPVLALLAACHSGAPVLSCLAVWLRCSLARSHAGLLLTFSPSCQGPQLP